MLQRFTLTFIFTLLLVSPMLWLTPKPVQAQSADCDQIGQECQILTSSNKTLFIVALAFDNNPTSTGNLAPYYEDTIQSLIETTQNSPDKTVVVLTDLTGSDNTFIQVINNGKALPIMGLPDNYGVLQNSLNEYDMANGLQLGSFLKWARITYPANKTVFSFVGHGSALVPETPAQIFSHAITSYRKPPRPGTRPPRPDITDYSSQGMISPYDLAQTLQLATNNSKLSPLDVVDLSHCFSGSIEELYELAPFAQALVATPNYGYVDPRMAGEMVKTIESTMVFTEMAQAVVTAYDKLLPEAEHPRLLVAVNSAKLLEVKTQWDKVAFHLLAQFDNNTKTKLKAAYEASAKYDTTYCAADWALTSPDGLVDLADFAAQVSIQFGLTSSVGQFAEATRQAVHQAIITKIARNGTPWFVPTQPTWTLNGAGLALYADLAGTSRPNNQIELSFQARWYSSTVTADNPFPYTFIQNGEQGATWATVFNRYWEGTNITTVACLPKYPAVPHEGEMTGRISSPLPGYVAQNSPITLKAVITSPNELSNPLVKFTAWQDNRPVFTEVVAAGQLITGAHEIATTMPWTPTLLGTFSVSVEFDSDQRVIESNETDNIVIMTDTVLPSTFARPVITAQVSDIWVKKLDLPLKLQANMELQRLGIQVYQYQPDITPDIQVPLPVGETMYLPEPTLPNLTLALPASLQPGVVILYIYGFASSGVSIEPAIIQFNYLPPNSALAVGQFHYFSFSTESGITHPFNLQSQVGDPNLFIWIPYNVGLPTFTATHLGNDNLTLLSPYNGTYLLAVYGQTATTYTLTVNGENSCTTGCQANFEAMIPQTRQLFVEPIPIPLKPLRGVYLPLISH